jgi:hypothetical protein
MKLKSPHIGRKTIDPSRVSGANTGLNAHILVAETAVKMANELFDVYMAANNELYRAMRQELSEKQARMAFVYKVAPTLLEDARQALTECLSQPDDVVSVRLKDQIADALIKDTDFRANRLVDMGRATIPSRLH